MEQKIKQDEIFIGKNIRRIRKEKGIRQTEMVALLQLENVMITREALVKDRTWNPAYSGNAAPGNKKCIRDYL